MKKINIYLSTLVLIATLLTACAQEATATTVPGTDVVPETMEPTATSDVVGTETVVSGDGTTTPGIPVTGEENPSRLSNQLDLGVLNQAGEQIGEVNDMILDLDNSRISYVIVGVGGFLGLGEKDVLVPWDSLRLQTIDSAGGQQNGFLFEGDQERFVNAPDWDANDLLPKMGEPTDDWDAEIRNFWESGVLPATASPDATATAVPEATVTTTPATGEGQPQPEDLQGVMLASDTLGTTVSLNQGQVQATGTPGAPGLTTSTPDAGQGQVDLGQDQLNATVTDMIVDPDSGEIQYIVINALFDDGERWIPVPLGFLQWNAANEALVVNLDMAALQNAPFFQEDQFPDTTVDGWNAEFEDFWANPEAGVVTDTQATPTP